MINIRNIEGAEPVELRGLIRRWVGNTSYSADVKLVSSHIEITKIKLGGKWLELAGRQRFAMQLKEHWQQNWFNIKAKVSVE